LIQINDGCNIMDNDHKVVDSSLKNILIISLPLILSALSNNLMFLIDRMILAYYSIDSMNAAAISGNLVAIFSFIFTSIAGISEIYVGQSNGKKCYSDLATPVWQMIYFSLLGFVILFPFGYFVEYISLIPEYCEKEALDYQRPLIYFSAIPAIKVALASFFIGQGKTKIITYTVLFGAISNIILDILFIFGYQNIIPEMGCKGAAIATILAETVQIFILAIVFFNKNNRLRYKTNTNIKFNKEIFKGCLRLGYPMSAGRIFELLAWYLVYIAISHVSKDLAIIQGICLSIYVLFAFICDGISKSAATISANLIGQKDLTSIKKSFKTFLNIIFVLGLIISIPLAIFPESLLFFLNMLHDDISSLYPEIKTIFKLLCFSIPLEAICSLIWGILMSGGDTKYPMIVNLCSLWGCVVGPICLLYYLGLLHSTVLIYWFTILWSIIILIFFYKRYQSLKWYNLLK
ncbi:MAG: MATE family efflux transporter, partial [Alphaproteobacteria bacterium]|nr:MATE family efflux transporter [Alphaproteobacteria bacterium]